MTQGLRMLVVEDNAVNREFLLAVLGRYGQAEAAYSGEEAVEIYGRALEEGRPFELVFMDVMLPGMDGLQTLENIRELERRLRLPEERKAKVIVATALDDERNVARAFFQGHAVSYITKPLSVGQILDELRGFGCID